MQANNAIQEASGAVNSEVLEQMKAKITKEKQKYEAKEKKFKGAIEALAAENKKLEQINLMHTDNQETRSQDLEKKLAEKSDAMKDLEQKNFIHEQTVENLQNQLNQCL